MARVHQVLSAAWLAALVLVGANVGVAQDQDDFALDESEEGSAAADSKVREPKQVEAAPGPERDHSLGDEQALEEESAPEERFRETTDPYEDPKKSYLFFGAGWRFARIPTWMLGAYHVEAGPAVSTPLSLSGELAYRKNGFQILSTVNYTKLNIHGPFQLKGDPVEDTEWLTSKPKILNLTAAITWSTSFTDWFQVEYGFEAGLGFLFADTMRSEAYKRSNGTWGKCPAWASQTTNKNDRINYNPAFPNPTPEQKRFCDQPVGDRNQPPPTTNTAKMDGAQYGVHAVRGLFHGGVPYVIPILGPRLSLRFKPIHQLVLRIDVPLPVIPFGIMGGLAASYGF